mmetsp:Transcript_17935/g.60988  ORF Transcript_17935/g.60988 Transcript_17935/m.60988 type:complete len:82 (-) Transcript_17935:891-1136(-)
MPKLLKYFLDYKGWKNFFLRIGTNFVTISGFIGITFVLSPIFRFPIVRFLIEWDPVFTTIIDILKKEPSLKKKLILLISLQ